MIELIHSSDDCCNIDYLPNRHLYRITFPMKTEELLKNSYRRRTRQHSTITYPIVETNGKSQNIESDNTSTTLTSERTLSTSPAVISSEEWCHNHRRIKLSNTTTIKQQKSLETPATFSFSLLFKAKIADTPVKCICKTK